MDMPHPFYLFFFFLILFFGPAFSAIPLNISPGLNITLPGQTGRNCTDVTTGWSQQCFLSQDVVSVLENYNTTFLPETCAPYELWSSCFQVSAYDDPALPVSNIRANISEYHNCTQLSLNTTLAGRCLAPNPAQKHWRVSDWYGAWNIYSLQLQLSTWGQAITSPLSRPTITNLTNTYPDYNASRILATMIDRYGIASNKMADAAIIQSLLYAPNSTRVPSTLPPYPAGHYLSHQRVPLPDESRGPTVQSWQDTLRQRLEEVLRIAMGDFDRWFDTIKTGYYSVQGGYETEGLLLANMQRGVGL